MTIFSRRGDENDDPVGARLRQPSESCGAMAFAEHVYAQTLVWRMADYAALAIDPGLIGRIRGAFGAALLDSASPQVLAGLPCPWSPPCAAETLWRKQGRMTPGLDFPASWLIAIDPVQGALDVSLTLFGFSCDCMPAAAEAMTAALLLRIDWRGETGLFVSAPRIHSRRLHVRERLDLAPPGVDEVALAFLSPAVLSKASPLDDPAPLFGGLPQRLVGLARWHDLRLDTRDLPQVRALFERIDWRWRDSMLLTWRRGSKKQDKAIPMSGAVGTLILRGAPDDLDALWPVLAYGEVFGVGADAAFGCGRYAMAV
jgi:hypothetical protein